jgi:hypothetical protein
VLKRSWILVTAATLLALPAMAGAPKGVAHVKNVNLAKRTMTLMGDEYLVTDETLIVDVRGTTTELKALRPAPTDGSLFGDDDVDAVEWRAVQTPTGWVLTDLRVLKKLPD